MPVYNYSITFSEHHGLKINNGTRNGFSAEDFYCSLQGLRKYMPNSKETIDKYVTLSKKAQGIPNWTDFIRDIAEGWVLSPPDFTSELLTEIEAKLGIKLPLELKRLYVETNGIQDTTLCSIVVPAKELISKNFVMRSEESFKDLYMPFDNLLFFGDGGNGDLYAYPIKMDGKIDTISIFVWDHEDDSRKWVAADIRDLILRKISKLKLVDD